MQTFHKKFHNASTRVYRCLNQVWLILKGGMSPLPRVTWNDTARVILPVPLPDYTCALCASNTQMCSVQRIIIIATRGRGQGSLDPLLGSWTDNPRVTAAWVDNTGVNKARGAWRGVSVSAPGRDPFGRRSSLIPRPPDRARFNGSQKQTLELGICKIMSCIMFPCERFSEGVFLVLRNSLKWEAKAMSRGGQGELTCYRWSSLNAPSTETPVSHSLLSESLFSFPAPLSGVIRNWTPHYKDQESGTFMEQNQLNRLQMVQFECSRYLNHCVSYTFEAKCQLSTLMWLQRSSSCLRVPLPCPH